MNDYRLQAFVKVYEKRGFAKAAAELHITQSGISQLVSNLEKDLGVSLFDRSGRPVVPTEYAELLYPRAREILREYEAANACIETHRAEQEGDFTLCYQMRTSECFMSGLLKKLASQGEPLPKLSHISPQDFRRTDGWRENRLYYVRKDVIRDGSVHYAEVRKLVLKAVANASGAFAALDRIRPEDLAGKTVMLPEEGVRTAVARAAWQWCCSRPGVDFTLEKHDFDSALTHVLLYDRIAFATDEFIPGDGRYRAIPLEPEIPFSYVLAWVGKPGRGMKEFVEKARRYEAEGGGQ